MHFVEELKRRNVFRVGIAYTVTAWLLLQVTDIVFPRIGQPDTAVTLVIALLALGFIPALIIAWADDARILALLATGNHVDGPPPSPINFPAKDW